MNRVLSAIPLLLFALVLTACSPIVDFTNAAFSKPKTIEDRYFVAKDAFNVLDTQVLTVIESRPLCEVEDVLGCVPLEAAEELYDAQIKASRRFATADALFEAGTEDNQLLAIRIAQTVLSEYEDVRNRRIPQ